MTDLRTAAQQALEALEAMQSYAAAERKGLRICDEAIPALRAALAQPNPQDPELSAALGWPGGISEPVLDRKTLLQMVAALRLASKQAQTCAWRDNLDAIYETECGNLHIVNDGTLEENGMKYCCYCGKEIKDESPT